MGVILKAMRAYTATLGVLLVIFLALPSCSPVSKNSPAPEEQEQEDTTFEELQQRREQLIELRSQHVKQRLDATQQQVEQHRQELLEAEGVE